jgi:predicted DNA-binding WGR domain protein
MNALTLHRIEPEKNMRRFYRLDVQPDLFGEWSFIREWGRIGRPGQVRMAAYPTLCAADAALAQQRQVKERLGYCCRR